ncbi:hypothetical protein JCM10295v2_001245 [Rhodotorula toruloides]
MPAKAAHIARNRAARGLSPNKLVRECEEDAQQRVYKEHFKMLDRQSSRNRWGTRIRSRTSL